jgi:hypothetical protein
MDMDLSEQERDCLLEILDAALRDKHSQMRFTAGVGVERYLERQINLLESMKTKFQPVEVV